LEKAFEIFTKLGKTNEKKNIMMEARDMFYDPMFMNSLDTNPYLLCCTNGVWDFKEKQFRDGKPEDYISKCTNIEYTPLTKEHAETVAEINDFMDKLFPIQELKDYMWDHLCSTVVGTSLMVNPC
jgi:phage/plasmid-associated DNA primase